MNVGDIFIKLGFKADTFTLKDFSKTIGELPMKAVTAAASLAGVSLEIGSLVKSAMEAAGGFQRFSAITGLSSDEMQRWGIVAGQTSVDVGAVESSFLNLDSAIKRMKAGTGGGALGSAFSILGLDYDIDNVNQMMPKIREQIAHMTKDQIDFAQERAFKPLGIDTGMIMRFGLMPKGEFDKRSYSVGVQTPADINAAAKFTSAFGELAQTIRHFVSGPMVDFAKVIEDIVPVLRKVLPVTYDAAKEIYTHLPFVEAAMFGFDKDRRASMLTGVLKTELFLERGLSLFKDKMTEGVWKPSMMESFAVTPSPGLAGTGRYTDGPRTVHNDNDLSLIQHNYFTGDPGHGLQVVTEAARQRIQAAQFFGNTGN